MEVKDLQDLLGVDIPNALKSVQNIEKKVAPFLAQVNANRDKFDPNLMAQFDSAMKDVTTAKENLKKYGNSNS